MSQDLDEVYGNGLFVKEPPTPHAKVIYSNKQRTFLPKKEITNSIKLFELKTTLYHIESSNAIMQIENELCSKTVNKLMNILIILILPIFILQENRKI